MSPTKIHGAECTAGRIFSKDFTFTTFRWQTRESNDTLPYSHHGYAYALSNPVLLTDPSGRCIDERIPWIGEPGCRIEAGIGQGTLNLADGGEHLWHTFQGVGLPGAMIADVITGRNDTQRILDEGGISTRLGMTWTSIATGRAAVGGFGKVTAFLRGSLVGGGLEYGTQVSTNYQQGFAGVDAWSSHIDTHKITKWGLLGGTSGVSVAAQPFASSLYGGTSALGYMVATALGGFSWDGFRTATATGLIGGGSAPVMARLPGLHGLLINTSQYTVGQWLTCQDLDAWAFGAALSVGWLGGRIGGAYTPLDRLPNPVRPLPTLTDQTSRLQAQAARELMNDYLSANLRVAVGSTIRSTGGSTTTNLPLQDWWNSATDAVQRWRSGRLTR